MTGDKVVFEGVTMHISKINLLTTEAYSSDGQHLTIPNQKLSSSTITSHRKSRDFVVNITFQLDWKSTESQIEHLKHRIIEWMKQDSAPWKADGMLSIFQI